MDDMTTKMGSGHFIMFLYIIWIKAAGLIKSVGARFFCSFWIETSIKGNISRKWFGWRLQKAFSLMSCLSNRFSASNFSQPFYQVSRMQLGRLGDNEYVEHSECMECPLFRWKIHITYFLIYRHRLASLLLRCHCGATAVPLRCHYSAYAIPLQFLL